LSIEAIPAFSDNYIWLLRREGTACAVVDPGDAAPVLNALRNIGLDLCYILLTHHHFDHIGGAGKLLEHYPGATVFGPDDNRIDCKHVVCREGDKVELPALSLELGVLEVPAHTRSHIAFFGHDLLFSGDTLFSVGCGKLFEGTPEQMQTSLDKIANLPPRTRVYCGHEYTLSNCNFALSVEPDNQALVSKQSTVKALREEGQITLPGMLEEELAVNPFMRTRQESVVEAARRIDPAAQPGASVLGVIRRWKDES
jgi:hydroxyacylglutathione hydrolase